MRLTILRISVLLGALCAPPAALAQQKPGPDATPVKDEVVRAYVNDRTWVWNDGGGLFLAKDGRAHGWTRYEGKEIWGEGTWNVSGGSYCHDLTWHSSTGSIQAHRCWRFVLTQDPKWKAVMWSISDKGETGWLRRGNEDYGKYKPGNLVGAQYQRLKAKQ